MRAQQFITEAFIPYDLSAVLIQKGYIPLGKQGADQRAFLEPDSGMVLKIFGTNRDTGDWSNRLTPGQNTFKLFYDYCMANPNNPFLPQCFGWERFEWDHQMYLQIRVERLFEFKGHRGWAKLLEYMARQINNTNRSQVAKQSFIDRYLSDRYEDGYDGDPDEEHASGADDTLFTHLGDNFDLLWDTIVDLKNIAKGNGIRLDLHEGNFMLGSDGEIVISDPFWCGSW